MNLKPLSNHLIIKPIGEEKTTKGGIVLPDNAENKPTKGEVVAAGPGRVDENGKIVKMSVSVGDKVLFKKYGPDEIEVDGEKYLIGDEGDVLAIIQ